jgi:hypothetical protein
MTGKLTYEELWAIIDACPVKRGSFYRHYKTGDEYHVADKVIAEATQEVMVIYRRPVGPSFVRPAAEFLEEVEHEGKLVPRFAPVE